MVIASAAIMLLCWLPLLRSEYLIFYCILPWDWKLEIHRIWNTEYTVLLVAEQRFSEFHDVFWWSRRLFLYSTMEWRSCNAGIISSASETLRVFNEGGRDTCVVLDFSPRFDPEGDTFRYVRDNLTDVQLEATDGSGALMMVKNIRFSVGPKSIQEGVRLLFDFFRRDSLRRNYGETMRHWTRRFTLQ